MRISKHNLKLKRGPKLMDSLMLPFTYDFTLNNNALKTMCVLQHNFLDLKKINLF